MTYVHPYDLFDAILMDCEAVVIVDGASKPSKVFELLSHEDEHFLYDMCELISKGLSERHPEWR